MAVFLFIKQKIVSCMISIFTKSGTHFQASAMEKPEIKWLLLGHWQFMGIFKVSFIWEASARRVDPVFVCLLGDLIWFQRAVWLFFFSSDGGRCLFIMAAGKDTRVASAQFCSRSKYFCCLGPVAAHFITSPGLRALGQNLQILTPAVVLRCCPCALSW